MSTLPRVAVPTNDLAASISFYVDQLGFGQGERPAADVIQIIEPGADGGTFLLFGPQAGDLTPYLAEPHFIFKVGETLRFARPDLDALRTSLSERGMDDLQIVETRTGDRVLDVQDPAGNTLRFMALAQRTPEKSLELYRECVDELEAALAGLSESDLDRSLTEDSWSIRQIVHHLADSEMLFGGWMKFMLIASGQTYTMNLPASGTGAASDTQQSTKRAIGPSVALVRASHEHIAQLAQYVPNAWERFTQDANGNKRIFGQFVTSMLGHVIEHAEEILAIRRAHTL